MIYSLNLRVLNVSSSGVVEEAIPDYISDMVHVAQMAEMGGVGSNPTFD